jgi:hypothetical protein
MPKKEIAVDFACVKVTPFFAAEDIFSIRNKETSLDSLKRQLRLRKMTYRKMKILSNNQLSRSFALKCMQKRF